jgi:hypothetical protein
LIEQGESLAYIRDQMGHSSMKVTVDAYGHLVPGEPEMALACCSMLIHGIVETQMETNPA